MGGADASGQRLPGCWVLAALYLLPIERPMNFNKILLGGNLTRDPETRTTQGGMTVCKFGLAVNRKFKDTEEVMFVDCTAFGKTAEAIAQYLDKGSPVFVEGRLQLEQWEDKEGGKRSKHSVVVDVVQFVGGDKDRGESPESKRESPRSRRESPGRGSEDYGDVPF